MTRAGLKRVRLVSESYNNDIQVSLNILWSVASGSQMFLQYGKYNVEAAACVDWTTVSAAVCTVSKDVLTANCESSGHLNSETLVDGYAQKFGWFHLLIQTVTFLCCVQAPRDLLEVYWWRMWLRHQWSSGGAVAMITTVPSVNMSSWADHRSHQSGRKWGQVCK